MCETLEVSRSGYYDYLKREKKGADPEKEKLIAQTKKIHEASRQTYGSRRISAAFREEGVNIGRFRARRLMKKAGVAVKQKKRFKKTTNSAHSLPIAPNILNRDFRVAEPNRAWVSDITYIWTWEGWLYLAAVQDLFSRRVVGWSIQDRMTSGLVSEALMMAIGRRDPESGLILHSDRGSQYASREYQQLLKEQEIICSMSRKGDCWDNAVMERFFRSLKSELIDHQRYLTKDQARKDIIQYIEMFYNSKRLHSYLGYKNPLHFESECKAG